MRGDQLGRQWPIIRANKASLNGTLGMGSGTITIRLDEVKAARDKFLPQDLFFAHPYWDEPELLRSLGDKG